MAKIMEEENENCEVKVIHKDIVEKVEKTMPEEEVVHDLSDFFKILGDTTRMKILSALFQEEMCVCDIAYLLKMTQSAISQAERKESKPQKKTREKLAKIYNCLPEQLSI